ncbi:ionotropic receptor 75a isoform X2 [Musca domestica]|uniref:Ionotropic receptor 75a isoform X2 n=2 Tax=Musca domestica TaxID=7370 RepID=A0ABM3VK61_MUSDO|nr:ionotropic receptor 75a isoform X2 [Musca domestica]
MKAYFFIIALIFMPLSGTVINHHDNHVSSYIFGMIKAVHTLVFTCTYKEAAKGIKQLSSFNTFMKIVNLKSSKCMEALFTPKVHAKTSIFIDCRCIEAGDVLHKGSNGMFFNKTYQWMLWDAANKCLPLLYKLKNIGPNAQLIKVHRQNSTFVVSDCHSKGRHLNAALEFIQLANFFSNGSSTILDYIDRTQNIYCRDNFNGLLLKAATVIDQDNITSNIEIEDILSRSHKESGVAAFAKYHYALFCILRERFNFTVKFRNARGWAGKLGNSSLRLGYIGIMQRNEADVGASASYNRINRFDFFDILHQGWKLETAFIYRLTPNIGYKNLKGDFFAPFHIYVWFIMGGICLLLTVVWMCIEYMVSKKTDQFTAVNVIPVNVVGAICQQGMDPSPMGISSRIISLTTFVFSLIFYNYYTSSVVGGLLGNTVEGPSTIDAIISSELKVSFEDIGYYKILFQYNKTPRIRKLLEKKVLPHRGPKDLPVYTHLEDALPYVKKGGHAFHCEVVDAYPEIAKQFDVSEICDLRVVFGLLESELLNFVIHKNSPFTEIFRIVMRRAVETGLDKRILKQRQPEKPPCSNLYTVYPVDLTGTFSAFIFLAGAIVSSLVLCCIEGLFKVQVQVFKCQLQ